MTTASVNIMADNDTDAHFRSGGSGLAAQLSAMGLVQTSDTGQINWTTVVRSGTVDSLRGYEIWKFNDALQATVPVYIRVEYRTGGTGNRWCVWISVGFATDGAGNLTGTQVTAGMKTQVSSNATLEGSIGCLFSGSTSRLAWALWYAATGSATIGSFFSIERSKDASGADNGDGVIILIAAGGIATTQGIKFSQFLPFTGGVPNAESQWPAVLTNNGSSAFGTTVHMGVPIPLAGAMKNPGMGALVFATGDFSSLTDYSMTIYGSAHTYKTLNGNWTNVIACGGSSVTAVGSNSRIAMRFE